MHEAYLRYPGSRREEQWLITDSASRAARTKTLAPQYAEKVLLLPVEVGKDTEGLVAARVEDLSDAGCLSPVLASASSLQYLSIPSRLAADLLAGPIPASLHVLHFSGTEIARIPGPVRLPGVARIIGDRIRCEPEQLPSLKHVDIRYEKASRAMISGNKGIETLNLRSLSEAGVLAELDTSSLQFLGLRGGSTVLIREISRSLLRLEQLWLQDLDGTLNLNALEGMGNLRELTVGYCRRVTGLETLVKLGALKSLHFFGCGEIGISLLRTALEGRLEDARIDGTS